MLRGRGYDCTSNRLEQKNSENQKKGQKVA